MWVASTCFASGEAAFARPQGSQLQLCGLCCRSAPVTPSDTSVPSSPSRRARSVVRGSLTLTLTLTLSLTLTVFLSLTLTLTLFLYLTLTRIELGRFAQVSEERVGRNRPAHLPEGAPGGGASRTSLASVLVSQR